MSELGLAQRLSIILKPHIIGRTETLRGETGPPYNERHLGDLSVDFWGSSCPQSNEERRELIDLSVVTDQRVTMIDIITQ